MEDVYCLSPVRSLLLVASLVCSTGRLSGRAVYDQMRHDERSKGGGGGERRAKKRDGREGRQATNNVSARHSARMYR